MTMLTHRRLLLVASIALIASGPARAQDSNDWAKKMFDKTSHDFGVVARGSEVSHRFKVTNLYKEDVHISNVTTTCGCTAPKYDQTPVKSLESTYVEISMDTNRFKQKKTSNVTVTFDQPLYGSVTIPVEVYIRSDVVLTPGSINFGAVDQGAGQERRMDIAYAYNEIAGRPDWKLTQAVTNNKYLKARIEEKARGNGQVNYDLIVSLLPDAPVGNLRQQVLMMTDDANSPQIPILVQARVEADVTVTPSIVQLGSVAPGAESTKTVLLRGRKPFVIDKVECESSRQAFKMPVMSKEPKAVHVISLTFSAPKENGLFSEKFIVTIAGRPEPLVFSARGTIETAQK